MGSSMSVTSISILAAVLGYVYLAIQQNTPKDSFQPLSVPGPVLIGSATGINLDGLTLVRTVKLPTIIIRLPGIGTIKLKNQTSELAFPLLRVQDVQLVSHDVASQATNISATVNTTFTGSCLAKVEFTLHVPLLGIGPKVFSSETAGRLKASIVELSANLPMSIGTTKTGLPAVRQNSLSFSNGRIDSFEFSASPHASIAAKLPLWLSMKPVANFLLSDALRSREVKEASAAIWEKMNPYLDLVPWTLISNIDRESAPPLLQSSIPHIQAHFSVLGQTNLTKIALPDHIPNLYPDGTKRAYLQSWNKLTSEVKLEITENAINRFSFNKAVLEWNVLPTVPREAVKAMTEEANIMVCRLENFNVEVTSHFAMYANTSKAIKFVTGMESLGEKGRSKAIVKASRLELVFRVIINEDGVSISTKSVDDFDSVEVSIEGLRSKKDDWVNNMLKVVRPHIASVASLMVKKLLENEVKKGTKAFETVEEALLLRGVEVPGLFRRAKRAEVEA